MTWEYPMRQSNELRVFLYYSFNTFVLPERVNQSKLCSVSPFSTCEPYEELESDSSPELVSQQVGERMSEMLNEERFRKGRSADAELDVVGLDCGVCRGGCRCDAAPPLADRGERGNETDSNAAIESVVWRVQLVEYGRSYED